MNAVFLDCETTGLDPTRHQITEVSWARADNPSDIKTFYLPVDIEKADPHALEVNRYYERGCDKMSVVPVGMTVQLWLDLQDATIIGANPAFDASFLKPIYLQYAQSQSAVTPWLYRLLDIEAYASGVFGWEPPLSGLRTISEYMRSRFNLDIPAPDHTSAGDVRTLIAVWEGLRVFARLNNDLHDSEVHP